MSGCLTVFSILQSQKENYEKHHNTADGRIRVWFGIRQIMNSTDRLLLETRDAARELKTGIHMVLISFSHVWCVHVILRELFPISRVIRVHL